MHSDLVLSLLFLILSIQTIQRHLSSTASVLTLQLSFPLLSTNNDQMPPTMDYEQLIEDRAPPTQQLPARNQSQPPPPTYSEAIKPEACAPPYSHRDHKKKDKSGKMSSLKSHFKIDPVSPSWFPKYYGS